MNSSMREWLCIACEPTVVLRLDREELLALMENQPALAIGMSQFLSMRVRSLQDRLDAG